MASHHFYLKKKLILEHPEANLQTCHQASAFDDQDRWRLSQSLQLLTLRCGEVVRKKNIAYIRW